MKEYKVDLSMYEGRVREVLSEAIQKKAFELGYEWFLSVKRFLGLKVRTCFLTSTAI